MTGHILCESNHAHARPRLSASSRICPELFPRISLLFCSFAIPSPSVSPHCFTIATPRLASLRLCHSPFHCLSRRLHASPLHCHPFSTIRLHSSPLLVKSSPLRCTASLFLSLASQRWSILFHCFSSPNATAPRLCSAFRAFP